MAEAFTLNGAMVTYPAGVGQGLGLWEYRVGIPQAGQPPSRVRVKEICLDFNGDLRPSVGNPETVNNDPSLRATDNDKFAWGVGNPRYDKARNKTFICYESRRGAYEDLGPEIRVRFVGPGTRVRFGGPSYHIDYLRQLDVGSQTVRKEDFFTGEWQVPVAMAVIPPIDDSFVDATPGPAVTVAFFPREDIGDVITLTDFVDASTARLPFSEVGGAPVTTLKGLTDAQWSQIAKTLRVSTIGELLSHPAIVRLSELSKIV